jgi:gliding motility-associated-like protein
VWNADPSLTTNIGATVIATPTITTTYIANSTINGCAQTASITIIVSSAPVSAISSNSPLCEGSALNLAATSVVGATYLWSGPNVFSSLTQNPTIISVTPLAAGTYTCLVAIGNCVSTYTTSIVVDAATPSVINTAGPFCISDLFFDLNSPNEPGLWSGAGIIDLNTGAFLPSSAGSGNSAITFDSDAYCTSPSTINIQVTSALSAAITPINPLCVNGSSEQLQVANAGGTWSGNAVNSSGMVSPAALGVGVFQAIYTIAGSCGGADTITIQVVPLPQFSFTSSAATGCAPLNVQFNSNSATALSSCVWSIDGVNVGSGCGSFNYNFQSAGCFTVALTSTDGNGCVNSVSQTDLVCIDLFPVAAFQWTPITPSLNNPLIEFTNLSLGNTTNQWNVNGELSGNTETQYTFSETIGSSFEACLEVSNQYGCADSTCYTIFVNREEMVFVPNSFSPNDDGLNDVFFPVLSGFNLNEIQYAFSIYNRYGERIFYSEDPNQAWIGNVYGNEFYAQIDAYTWSLQITTSSFTEPIELTGSVVAIR